jgi:hypothetical protein
MACVFLLGPKTSFGQSEQNPAYWLQLLLAAKKTGAQCTWYDPVADKHQIRMLSPNDWNVWLRFFMSFLINGVGFHILVHALPIQVATQSSLTGVVFRAVGMMYLVDLDDTPGYTLRLVEEQKPETTTAGPGKKVEEVVVLDKPEASNLMGNAELSAEASRIIDEAREKLDTLARGEIPVSRKSVISGALLLAGAESSNNGIGATTNAGVAAANAKKQDMEEGGADGGGDEGADGGADA